MATELRRQEYIDRINAWAARRGAPPVTSRMLEDWDEEGIALAVTKAVGTYNGRAVRLYGAPQFRRALTICLMKKKGIRRYSALRVALWLRGCTIRGELPREDLEKEFTRSTSQLIRPISSTYPSHSNSRNPKKEATLLKQAGDLSPRLLSSPLRLSDDHLIEAIGLVREGGPSSKIQSFLTSALDRIPVQIGKQLAIAAQGISQHLSWLAAPPSEKDGLQRGLIATASDQELMDARRIMLQFSNFPLAPAQLNPLVHGFLGSLKTILCAAICASREDLRWRVSLFVAFLIGVKCLASFQLTETHSEEQLHKE